MIDFHNHVLHNVDDGPKTIEESLEMLKCASTQGITDIVQTVHFQHPKMYGKNVEYDFLIQRLEELQNAIEKEKLDIIMHLSAEVFYLPNLVEIASNPLVTIGNAKYMLIEFTTNIFPTGYQTEIFKLQSIGITPVIAHPERYRFIQNDLSILEDWIRKNYIIQIDAGSLIGHFGERVKNISQEMIKSGYVHLIGSDAHNNKKRNFCLQIAYDELKKNVNIEMVDSLKRNAYNLLNGSNIENIVYEKKINFKKKILSYFKDKVFNLEGRNL